MPAFLHSVLAGASAICSCALRPAPHHQTSVIENAQRLAHSVVAYEAFRLTHGVDVERINEDERMYHQRVALFQRRSDGVKAHNALNRGWVQAVNKFADLTDEEFHLMLGHSLSQRGRVPGAPQAAFASSFIAIEDVDLADLAETVDYRSTLNASLGVKDQGSCGSCWAVAVGGAMETHAEHHSRAHVPQVSYEQLVDCVQNPSHCGGTGGCQGATSELAFEYIVGNGIALVEDYAGYQSGGDGECSPPHAKAMTADGFVRLPENQAFPLREALANHGPVVVSAEASEWMLYDGGVFSGCNVDATINHAILMMGYGVDGTTGVKFWLIRNSWGPDWGEGGYIRLLRHEDSESYCGIDKKPKDGVGCDGGPPELPVCGMCGILSDSAYPTGVQIVSTL